MREHRFDAEEAALRPKSARVDDSLRDEAGRAAAQGRGDVLGPAGLLGLQRAAGNSGVTAMVEEERSPVHDVVASSGKPLEPEVREDMEGRLGHDFSDVRVHDDGAAHDSATAVNAHAYTVGSNIVFQRDTYDPSSTQGRTVLAHELTHVVQQRHGPVDGTPAGGGINVSDPSDRFEREAAANAERAVAEPTPSPVPAPSPAGTGAVVQREASEEEEEEPTAQGSFVQRQEAEEEEEEAAG
jgi:hypothetical protein